MTDRTWEDPSADTAAVDQAPFYLVYDRSPLDPEWSECDRWDASGLDLDAACRDLAADAGDDEDLLVLEVRPVRFSRRTKAED